ncbi:DotA/TraY family protein [Thiotrichales bacterium 19S3-7]|nr:DotA/TraY family protein [Thiotrichales bacterium 19S3-7]MCF6801889.1 DotA/TraY family protein [Thiotrichales bacterium 19S3-11]
MNSTIWGTDVAKHDASVNILQTVFGGDVSTLLTSVDKTLFSVTFKYFNTGLLAITFVLYTFILIIGTINTAKDGQFLGKNWSGHWISLRIVFGTICAVPLTTGYCVAQYLIFAMVTAGISFADYVWKEVVGDVVSNNVPAVVSSQVSNNINTYFATYMMSNLTKDLLDSSVFVKQQGSSGNQPCTQSTTAKSLQIQVPYPYIINGNGQKSAYNGSGNVAGTDYVSKQVDVYPISCNINFSTAVTNSFVQSYSQPLAAAVELNSDGNLDNSVSPFKDYASALGQGLSTWSQVHKDKYVQFQLNTANWVGTMKVNQMVNQPSKDNIKKIANQYGLSNYGYLTVNLPNNSTQLNPNHNPLSENNYSPTAMDATSTQIINWLEKNSAAVTQGCSSSDTNNLCYQAKEFGWWNADTLYLSFDNALSQNLQNLYANFAIFANAANQVSNQTSIPVDYDHINISYTENKNSISDLIDDGANVSFNPLTTSSKQFQAQADLTPFKDQLSKSGTFTTSMSNVRTLFNQIINDSGLSATDKSLFAGQVNSLLADGMQFQYAQYIYIMYSLTNSIYSPYENPNSSYSSGQKKDEANLLFNMVVQPVINLFNFFSTNGIEFGGSQNPVNTATITDPAQQLLSEIFDEIGTNSNSSEAGGLLQEIYNIGCVNGDCSGDSNYQLPSGGTDFAAQNFSMIQNVQAVGMSLIEGTINSMVGIFSHAKDQLQQIQNSADQQFNHAKSNATTYSIINGVTLGLAGNSLSAASNLEYVKAMYDVTMQLATFSLSLMWLPLIIFVLSSIFSIGISFSLVIPLTPYILFWAGKTAWLLLVIEAMAAAPFVSLGLVYPEGHEVFGKAEPGIQICMNLVLRPVFMILGMIFGIGLTYVIIQYSAYGFHAIADSLLNLMPASDGTSAATYARGTFSCMIIFMYATFLSMAFMKCFSLIYVIPDKVLQWIGNTRGERAGESEIQEFKGAAQSYAQSAGQAGGQTMSQGIEAEKSYTSSYIQGQKDISQSTSQRNMAISNDSSGVAKQAGEAALML